MLKEDPSFFKRKKKKVIFDHLLYISRCCELLIAVYCALSWTRPRHIKGVWILQILPFYNFLGNVSQERKARHKARKNVSGSAKYFIRTFFGQKTVFIKHVYNVFSPQTFNLCEITKASGFSSKRQFSTGKNSVVRLYLETINVER